MEITGSLRDNYVAFAVLRATGAQNYFREKKDEPILNGLDEGLHRWMDQRFN